MLFNHLIWSISKTSRLNSRFTTCTPYFSTFLLFNAIIQIKGERGAKEGIPALISYGTTQSAAVLDATSPEAVKWFTEKLNDVLDKYKVLLKFFNIY